jgi:UDP-glucose 4-epimerase
VPTTPVPWATAQARFTLDEHRRAFMKHAGGGPWSLVWCAGAGVTASRAGALDEEVATFTSVLESLSGDDAQGGTITLASSAGGVYAGAVGPPFDEGSAVAPLAPYGRAKLAMEQALTRWAAQTGGRALVGRLGNLYGPGQDIDKPQGLISQLLRAHLLRRPLTIYVPLDTIRDYVFVSDAAQRLLSATQIAMSTPPGSVTTKVVASQQGQSIAAVLGELRRVLQRRPQIIVGSSPVARFQARDLRLRSTVWREVDRVPLTPLPAGIHASLSDLTLQLQRGDLMVAR